MSVSIRGYSDRGKLSNLPMPIGLPLFISSLKGNSEGSSWVVCMMGPSMYVENPERLISSSPWVPWIAGSYWPVVL